MKRQFSAGGLVYKNDGGVRLWLIRRPTPNPEYRGNLGWSFPKGWLDDEDGGLKPGQMARGEIKGEEEEIEKAALREVGEEGGVEAKIVKKLKTLRLFFIDGGKDRVMKFITYYLMEYVKDNTSGHDGETEEVRWVNKEEAFRLLAFKNEKELLGGIE